MIVGACPRERKQSPVLGMSGRKGMIFNTGDQRDLLQIDMAWRRRKERDGRQLGGAGGAWCYQDMCA
jgi:hypothetical protein